MAPGCAEGQLPCGEVAQRKTHFEERTPSWSSYVSNCSDHAISIFLQAFRLRDLLVLIKISTAANTSPSKLKETFCTVGKETVLPSLSFNISWMLAGRNAGTHHSSFSLKYANDMVSWQTEVHFLSLISKDPSLSSKRVSVHLVHKQLCSVLIQTFMSYFGF